MISINNLSVVFGGFTLINDINFHISEKDRIGLVGKNGSGKSTLLKIIVGLNKPSAGQVVRPSLLNVGYLPQQMEHAKDKSVLDEALTAFAHVFAMNARIDKINQELAEREDYESDSYHKLIEELNDLHYKAGIYESENIYGETERTLLGLGFKREELSRPTSTFSQGWNMRIELAKVLLRKPDLLLLDEPTNHLDIESIQWLEDYLQQFPGAIVLISHDRKFLDNITKRTVELMLGKAYDYKVPYSQYLVLRKERIEQQRAAYDNQQRLIEKTEEFIEKFRYKPTKSNQVQSRIKQLDKLDRIEIDEEDKALISIKFPPAPRSGQVAVRGKSVGMSFGEKNIFRNADITIERGEKVAFVGRNGEGKTTMMRIIVKELENTEGTVETGHNVALGYYAQNQEDLLDKNDTVYDTLDKIAVGDIRTKLRDILGAFLFRGEDIDKKVAVLSGGERARLAMAKLILNPYNLLALDEPTNHMDIRSKDVLKQALANYDGTLIVVSHDRDFLDGLVDKIYEFRDGKVKEYLGGVMDFLDSKKMENLSELERKNEAIIAEKIKESAQEKEKQTDKTQNKHLSYTEQKEIERQQRKIKTQIDNCEKRIETLEKEVAELEEIMSDPSKVTNYQEMILKYNKLKSDLDQQFAEWERLNTL